MSKMAHIAVIGAGWWVTENHLPILEQRNDVELTAVCRRSLEELKRVKERFGFGFAAVDYREMLDLVPLDGVIVGSPHDVHYEHTKAALERDLHVMVEKPLATRTRDARELVKLAEKKGLQILIPHGWNFKSYSRQARRLVREGAVGAVEHVVLQMASPRKSQYAGEAGAEGSLFRQKLSTYADPGRGGGYGWGQLVHGLGLLFYITELSAEQVFAWMCRSPTGADLYDTIALRFRNGVTGALSGSATVPAHRGYQLDLRLFGTEGMLLLDVERERLELRRHDGEDAVMPVQPGDGEYACVEPVERFARICLGEAVENDAPGEVGLRSVEVLEAAYRSARSGRAEVV